MPDERLLVFDRYFFEDPSHWIAIDRKVALKVFALIEDIRRDPFRGIRKPEPLRHLGSGISVQASGREKSPASIAWFTG